MDRLYRHLDLGPFPAVRPLIEAYFAGQKDYKPNRHEVSEEMRAKVDHHWGDIVKRFGYQTRKDTSAVIQRRDMEGMEKSREDLAKPVPSA